jgi:hypothetical protein
LFLLRFLLWRLFLLGIGRFCGFSPLLVNICGIVRLLFREWLTESMVIAASGLAVEWDKSMAACLAEGRRPPLGGFGFGVTSFASSSTIFSSS